MCRILVVSHTGRGTGFGRISGGIAGELAAEHEGHVVGLGREGTHEPWTGHDPDPSFDPTRTTAAGRVTAATNPDVVILVGVGRLLAWIVTCLRRDGFEGVIVGYVPVEGRFREGAPLDGLRQATAVVAYTHMAAKELAGALAAPTPGCQSQPQIVVIPHAIDRPVRCGQQPHEQTRVQLAPERAERSEGVWVLNANRNDHRKRPELTLQAFAAVAARHPQVTLVLHCQLQRPGVDLRIERNRLGLAQSVIFTRELRPELWSDSSLAQLYSCCEVGVNSSTGDGWGLVAFEHALCGGAQILPAHPQLREIWETAPEWIPTAGDAAADDLFIGQVPDVDALSAAMLRLVEQPEHLGSVAAACASRALDPAFAWRVVGARWLALVTQLLDHGPHVREAQRPPPPSRPTVDAGGAWGSAGCRGRVAAVDTSGEIKGFCPAAGACARG